MSQVEGLRKATAFRTIVAVRQGLEEMAGEISLDPLSTDKHSRRMLALTRMLADLAHALEIERGGVLATPDLHHQ